MWLSISAKQSTIEVKNSWSSLTLRAWGLLDVGGGLVVGDAVLHHGLADVLADVDELLADVEGARLDRLVHRARLAGAVGRRTLVDRRERVGELVRREHVRTTLLCGDVVADPLELALE